MSTSVLIPSTTKLPDDIKSLEFSSYKTAIENLAATNAGSVFDINNPVHTAIVLGNILKKSSNSLKLFAGNLSGEISSNKYFLDALLHFLDRRIPFTIIFDKPPSTNSAAFALIKSYANLNSPIVNLLQIKDTNNPTFANHFTLGDDRMFSLQKDATGYHSFCSFNNAHLANALNSIFSTLMIESININPITTINS